MICRALQGSACPETLTGSLDASRQLLFHGWQHSGHVFAQLRGLAGTLRHARSPITSRFQRRSAETISGVRKGSNLSSRGGSS